MNKKIKSREILLSVISLFIFLFFLTMLASSIIFIYSLLQKIIFSKDILNKTLLEYFSNTFFAILIAIVLFFTLLLRYDSKKNPIKKKSINIVKFISYALLFITASLIVNDTIIGASIINKTTTIEIFNLRFSVETILLLLSNFMLIILSDVYKRACKIKEENDFTI